jgi:uncharacterized glyoxalase superfamily protein PhnB
MRSGVQVTFDIRNEEWGQRHFMVTDPGGMTIDVVQAVEASSEYKDSYVRP